MEQARRIYTGASRAAPDIGRALLLGEPSMAGSVRELANVLAKAVLRNKTSGASRIEAEHLDRNRAAFCFFFPRGERQSSGGMVEGAIRTACSDRN